MRACAKFVYLFKNFQCVLSYHISSLGRGNINGLWFHLVKNIYKNCQVSLDIQYSIML